MTALRQGFRLYKRLRPNVPGKNVLLRNCVRAAVLNSVLIALTIVFYQILSVYSFAYLYIFGTVKLTLEQIVIFIFSVTHCLVPISSNLNLLMLNLTRV